MLTTDFPGLLLYYLPLALTIIHGSGRQAKKKQKKNTGKAWEHWSHEIHEVDVGGGGQTAKTMHWIVCLSPLPQFQTLDLSMIKTTCLDW